MSYSTGMTIVVILLLIVNILQYYEMVKNRRMMDACNYDIDLPEIKIHLPEGK